MSQFKSLTPHDDQANVLIGDDGQAKVCDFGVTRLLAEETMGMTTTSAHIGTMRYLAHELVMGDEQPVTTAASDIHALGCLGLEVRYRSVTLESKFPFTLFTCLHKEITHSF
jgi:serine/threonine protein kinase